VAFQLLSGQLKYYRGDKYLCWVFLMYQCCWQILNANTSLPGLYATYCKTEALCWKLRQTHSGHYSLSSRKMLYSVCSVDLSLSEFSSQGDSPNPVVYSLRMDLISQPRSYLPSQLPPLSHYDSFPGRPPPGPHGPLPTQKTTRLRRSRERMVTERERERSVVG
jgi:hypothetical protein